MQDVTWTKTTWWSDDQLHKQDLRSTREDPRYQAKSKHEDRNQVGRKIAKKRAHRGDRMLVDNNRMLPAVFTIKLSAETPWALFPSDHHVAFVQVTSCTLLNYKTITCKFISLSWLCWSSNNKIQSKWAYGPFFLHAILAATRGAFFTH